VEELVLEGGPRVGQPVAAKVIERDLDQPLAIPDPSGQTPKVGVEHDAVIEGQTAVELETRHPTIVIAQALQSVVVGHGTM
jgi:hypothetical protein